MKHIEPIFKWICLLLIAVILFIGAYNWRDSKYEASIQKCNNLAVPLAQLNNLIGTDQVDLIRQVNAVLINNGYANLVRKVEVIENKE